MKTAKNKNIKKSGNTAEKRAGSREERELNEKTTDMALPDDDEIPDKRKVNKGIDPDVADITVSSSDEEGEDVFMDDIDEEVTEQETDLSEDEQKDLFRAANDMPGDDSELREAALDNTDADGTPLNEESFQSDVSADDLDVPGTALDDSDEEIGEEDEENNEYSLGDPDQNDEEKDE